MNQPILDWARGRAMMRVSQEVRKVVDVGRANSWRFRPMGRAHVPSRPVYLRDWVVVPVGQDTSRIPSESLERVRALFEAGLRPKTFIVAHETPRLLTAPKDATRMPEKPAIDWDQVREKAAQRAKQLSDKLPDMAAVGTAVVKGLTIVGIASGALALVPILLVGAVGAVALADPILIAVTEDDYWVEIDRWYV